MPEPNENTPDSPVEQTAEGTETKATKAPAKSSRRKKNQTYSKPQVMSRFSSCGRCGLFLTAYRLNHGNEFEDALAEIEANWLTLPWHPDMRELVNKSYGCPIDVRSYFFEGSCPECHRSFSYAEPEPDQPAWFLVKL